jgi:uncharacterized protein YciI
MHERPLLIAAYMRRGTADCNEAANAAAGGALARIPRQAQIRRAMPEAAMPVILLRLHPPRPGFPKDASSDEEQAMTRHAVWWQGLADAGQAIAVGPVLDPAGVWGLAIVIADDEAAALQLVEDDPVIVGALGFRYTAVAMGALILPGS